MCVYETHNFSILFARFELKLIQLLNQITIANIVLTNRYNIKTEQCEGRKLQQQVKSSLWLLNEFVAIEF